MATGIKKQRKLSGGAGWEGSLWHPGGATPEQKETAEKFGNAIVTSGELLGRARSVLAFGGVERFALAPFVEKDGKAIPMVGEGLIMLPNHAGIRTAFERLGSDVNGACVAISYQGEDKVQSGEWKGRMVKVYEIDLLDPSAFEDDQIPF